MRLLIQHKPGAMGGRTMTMARGVVVTPEVNRRCDEIDRAIQKEFGWDDTRTLAEEVIRERIETVARRFAPDAEIEIRIRGVR